MYWTPKSIHTGWKPVPRLSFQTGPNAAPPPDAAPPTPAARLPPATRRSPKSRTPPRLSASRGSASTRLGNWTSLPPPHFLPPARPVSTFARTESIKIHEFRSSHGVAHVAQIHDLHICWKPITRVGCRMPRVAVPRDLWHPAYKINLLKSSSFTISPSLSFTSSRVILTFFSCTSGASKLIFSNTFSRIV